MRRIFKFKELIAIVLSIVSSIFFIKTDKFVNIKEEVLAIYPALLNIVILLLGMFSFSIFSNDYYLIKRKHGEYDDLAKKDLTAISDVLKLPVDSARYFVERTSAIVGQLVKNFSLFLWPLVIFYTLNIVKDYMHLNAQVGFQATHSLAEYIQEYGRDEGDSVLWYILLSVLANIFNFLSAIGLWVCFTILYQKTLDADNKSTLHLGIYYFLLIFYILAYIILLGTGIKLLTIAQTILTLDLFCSIFNCVAMVLFFNRLVQILYFYQSSLREKLLDKFYFFIATILFPLYACFQIFFAVFDQLIPGGSNYAAYYVQVKGGVFFVCFLGKLFLILFLFSFIRIKWLHAAILTLIAYEDTPMLLAKSVTAISNSIDAVSDDIRDIKEG